MGDIQFEGEQEFARQTKIREPHGFVALVQKWGLAKDDRQAEYVLLGVILIMVVLAVLIMLFSGGYFAPHQSMYLPGQSVFAPPQGR